MILDILTPGDWQDSYSSREVRFHNEVSCLQDILNVIICEFENGRHISRYDNQPIFNHYDIKLYDDDYNQIADWNFYPKTWELEIIPPIKFVDDPLKKGRICYTEPFGHQRYRIPVFYPERAYKC